MNFKKLLSIIIAGMLLLSVFDSRVYAVENTIEGVEDVEQGNIGGLAQEFVLYEVQTGDCLWEIAERFLGDGVRYTDIVAWNEELIQDPNLIYPGTVFKIMANVGAEANAEAEAETETETEIKIETESGDVGDGKVSGQTLDEVSGDLYVQGTVNGTSWESEWLNMRLDLPEGFEFRSVDEYFYGLDAEDAAEDDNESDDSEEISEGEFVVVNPHYPGLTAFLATERMDYSTEEFMDELKKQFTDSVEFDIEWSSEGITELGGQSFEHYSAESETMGVFIYQDYYATKKDNTLIFLAVIYMDYMESEVEALIDGFSEYEYGTV